MAEQKDLARNVHQEEEEWQYIKSYMFIKGFAVGKDLKKTQTALALAKQLHAGQYRKDGTPYISHPLKVCSTLISYGIDDDTTLAAALLHDVLEDSGDRLPGGGEEYTSWYDEPEITSRGGRLALLEEGYLLLPGEGYSGRIRIRRLCVFEDGSLTSCELIHSQLDGVRDRIAAETVFSE